MARSTTTEGDTVMASSNQITPFPKKGTRVRIINAIERYPHFIASVGLTGIVDEVDDDIFGVLMDEPLEGCHDTEWENVVIVHHRGDYDEEDWTFYLEVINDELDATEPNDGDCCPEGF
jgi:hypothetical protein